MIKDHPPNPKPVYYIVGPCSLGFVMVAGNSDGVCAVSIGQDAFLHEQELLERYPNAEQNTDSLLQAWLEQIIQFIENPYTMPTLPLTIQGTAFQRRVWQQLQRIPCGSTQTYAEVARNIGAPQSVRAVANACASNTLALLIPCHRVVRQDGSLSGYRWGVERKRELLLREQRAPFDD